MEKHWFRTCVLPAEFIWTGRRSFHLHLPTNSGRFKPWCYSFTAGASCDCFRERWSQPLPQPQLHIPVAFLGPALVPQLLRKHRSFPPSTLVSPVLFLGLIWPPLVQQMAQTWPLKMQLSISPVPAWSRLRWKGWIPSSTPRHKVSLLLFTAITTQLERVGPLSSSGRKQTHFQETVSHQISSLDQRNP